MLVESLPVDPCANLRLVIVQPGFDQTRDEILQGCLIYLGCGRCRGHQADDDQSDHDHTDRSTFQLDPSAP